MEKINDIVNKSEEILDKIGYPLYAGTYFPEEYFGREYKFDILKIDLYDSNLSNRNMHIYIGSKEVLNYNYNKEASNFFVEHCIPQEEQDEIGLVCSFKWDNEENRQQWLEMEKQAEQQEQEDIENAYRLIGKYRAGWWD